MAVTILFWESDPVLKEALFRTLSWKGFQPIALDNPSQLAKAIVMEKPELSIIEGDWQPGSRISFDQGRYPQTSAGELSIISPAFGVNPSGMPETYGIVLENLRKPFGSAELFSGIKSAIRKKDRLKKTPLPWEQYLEVKRLETEKEILSAMELRYEVYHEVGFLKSSTQQLEFDKYDANSIFLGAFVNNNGTRELAGMVRIIKSLGRGPHQNALLKIFHQFGNEYPASSAHENYTLLPAFSSFGLTRKDIPQYCPEIGAPISESRYYVSTEICEISRLVIHHKYRMHKYGIERRLFELIVVDSCAEEPKRNWFAIAVHPSRAAKFERLGFRKVSSLGVHDYNGISQPATLMTLDLWQYLCSPNPFTRNLDLNSLIYKANGVLLHNLQDRAVNRQKAAS
ncbi:hypothetical protein ACFL5K_00395 [Gemmatimonadota bacterium]